MTSSVEAIQTSIHVFSVLWLYNTVTDYFLTSVTTDPNFSVRLFLFLKYLIKN